MDICQWKERINVFRDQYITIATERNGTFYGKSGRMLYILTKELREKIKGNDLNIHLAYQRVIKEKDGENKITIFLLENGDFVSMRITERNEIERVAFIVEETDTKVKLNDFAQISKEHFKICKFIKNEFIDNSQNRLDFITGIKKI